MLLLLLRFQSFLVAQVAQLKFHCLLVAQNLDRSFRPRLCATPHLPSTRGVLVRHIFVRMADPELFEVPRHTVLSQMHHAESPEAVERLSILFLQAPYRPIQQRTGHRNALQLASMRPIVVSPPIGHREHRYTPGKVLAPPDSGFAPALPGLVGVRFSCVNMRGL